MQILEEFKSVSNDIWKFIISNMKINIVQQHNLRSSICILHNTGDVDPFFGGENPIQDNYKTVDEYNDMNDNKHYFKKKSIPW